MTFVLVTLASLIAGSSLDLPRVKPQISGRVESLVSSPDRLVLVVVPEKHPERSASVTATRGTQVYAQVSGTFYRVQTETLGKAREVDIWVNDRSQPVYPTIPLQVRASTILIRSGAVDEKFVIDEAKFEQDSPVRIGGKTLSSHLVSKVKPRAPDLPGVVVVEVIVERDGTVSQARAVQLRGHPVLADAAEAAVSLWKFRPFHMNGATNRVLGTVTVLFP